MEINDGIVRFNLTFCRTSSDGECRYPAEAGGVVKFLDTQHEHLPDGRLVSSVRRLACRRMCYHFHFTPFGAKCYEPAAERSLVFNPVEKDKCDQHTLKGSLLCSHRYCCDVLHSCHEEGLACATEELEDGEQTVKVVTTAENSRQVLGLSASQSSSKILLLVPGIGCNDPSRLENVVNNIKALSLA